MGEGGGAPKKDPEVGVKEGGADAGVGEAPKASLQAAIDDNPVMVVGRSTCPFCIEAVSTFRAQGVEPRTFWLDKGEGSPGWHDACKGMFSQKTVPYVFVRGEFIGGCDETTAELKSGALAKRLVGLQASNGAAGGLPPNSDCPMGIQPRSLSQTVGGYACPRPLFYFPDLVDSWTARVGAGLVSAIAITSIPLRANQGMHFAVLGLLLDFSLRLVFGPGPSPLANLAKCIVALLRWNKPPNLVQAWPKQFATFIGVICSALGTIFYFIPLYGTRVFGAVIMAMLAFFAALECLLNFCMGCYMFSWMVRLGIVPKSVYKVGVDSKPEAQYMWEYGHESRKLGKPEIVTRRMGPQPTYIDFKYKMQDQEDHERFDWSIIRHTKARHFQISTALLAVAAMFKFASASEFGFSISSSVWKVLLGIAFVVFVITNALYLLRTALYPRKVWKEWMCPVNSNSFSVWAIAMMLLAFLLVDLWGAGRTMGKVMWWIGAPLQLGLVFWRVSSIVGDRMSYEAINAGWLMQPTGCFVAVIVGPYLDPSNYTEASYLWMGVGLILWLVLFAITLGKAITDHASDDRFRSLTWAWVAAPAAASVAWAVLQAAPNAVGNDLPVVAADAFSKLLYFAALGLCFSLALGFVRGFYGRAKFDATADWTYVFPLAVLAFAAVVYEAAVPGNFTRGIVYIALGVTSWAAVFLSLQTIWTVLNGGLFKPDAKWGPMSIMRLTHEAFRSFIPRLLASLDAAAASPGNAHALAAFLENWRQFVVVLGAHTKHEDGVIFPTVDQYVPGTTTDRGQEHQQHHEKDEERAALVAELAGSCGPERAAAVLKQLKAELPPFMSDMQEHLRKEEITIQPVARKLIPLVVQKQMLSKIFNQVTTPEEWRTYLPWAITNLPMLPQKVRFLRCFLWAVPERGELIGRMVAMGVDGVTWARIKEHVPEVIPRGAPGWRRYY